MTHDTKENYIKKINMKNSQPDQLQWKSHYYSTYSKL